MTKIIRTFERSKKRKTKTKAQLALEAEWLKIVSNHKAPLEKGAKANGVKVKTVVAVKAGPQKQEVSRPAPLSGAELMTATTKPILDPLKDAKHALKGRLGAAYNKGGIQYLTDDELAEQRTGAHKRR